MTAFKVVIETKRATGGLDEEEERALLSIASDIANPILSVGRDMILVPGSLSSGVLQTLLTNNIVNSLLFRYAFVKLHPGDVTTADKLQAFEDNVTFFALGDDTCVTVSDEVVPWFNMATLAKFFGTIGIKYTSADKSEAGDVASLPLSEATIGKRRWEWDGELGIWRCPLERPSIGKMLTIGLASASMTLERQQFESWRSAWPELAQHPQEEYDAFVRLYRECGHSADPPERGNLLLAQSEDSCVPWQRSLDEVSEDEFSPTGL